MKCRIPVMVQDPSNRKTDLTETISLGVDQFQCFLDGPVTDRLAVLDFHPKTGKLRKGVPIKVTDEERDLYHYEVRQETDFQASDFCARNTFGIVAQTMKMFEEADVLGRKVNWAFESPQLFIVPQAGEWTNAFYQRGSSSLQFFRFHSIRDPKKVVYTCLARDIVAHETGHAVLDGICPDLYDAVTPQSLALHEAVADLTSLIMSFRSPKLLKSVLEKTRGSIEDSSAFSAIAEEFGREAIPGNPGYLRSLKNDLKLTKEMERADPHALCKVLTGAVYTVAEMIFENEKKKALKAGRGKTEFSVSGFALFKTQELLSRMLFRALDYLPPGEVSFLDYGRAIWAADAAMHPKQGTERRWFAEQFKVRRITRSISALKVRTNYWQPVKIIGFDLDEMVSSDFVAYTFASQNREYLGIPANIPFEVQPRLDVTKQYWPSGEPKTARELIFKVSWQQSEEVGIEGFSSCLRRFTVGTTLAINWDDTQKALANGKAEINVRAKLTSAHEEGKADRELMTERLLEMGLLTPKDHPAGLDGIPSQLTAQYEIAEGLLRVRGTGKALHMMGVK